MQHISLSESGFERKTKRTRKREFLDEMNLVVPWAELLALIARRARVPGAHCPLPQVAALHSQYLHQAHPRAVQPLYQQGGECRLFEREDQLLRLTSIRMACVWNVAVVQCCLATANRYGAPRGTGTTKH